MISCVSKHNLVLDKKEKFSVGGIVNLTKF